jgi:hypothetical protein
VYITPGRGSSNIVPQEEGQVTYITSGRGSSTIYLPGKMVKYYLFTREDGQVLYLTRGQEGQTLIGGHR